MVPLALLLVASAAGQFTLNGRLQVPIWNARDLAADSPLEAMHAYEEVVEGYSRHLGASHPETLRAKVELSGLMADGAQMNESKHLYQQVIHDRKETLGRNHTATVEATAKMADLLIRLGEHGQAFALYEEVAQGYEQQLGRTNAFTRLAKMNLAHMSDYTNLEQLGLTREIYADVVVDLSALLVPTHPSVNRAKYFYADLLHAWGDHAQAKLLLSQSVSGLSKALGPYHMYTTEAEALYRRI
jgi:hypothetical protein